MKIRKLEITSFIIVVLSFIAGLFVYPYLPETIASHWSATGEVNGYMSKFWGVFLMPIISAAMLLLLVVVPRIDPKKENIEKFRKYFDRFILLIFLFLLYIYGLTLWWNLGGRFNMSVFLIPAFAILLYFIGSLVSNAKMNYSIGIRTPWTLANERVWQKTHAIGGKLFKGAAFLSLLGIFFPNFSIWFVLIPVLFVTIVTVVYSYLEYRRQEKS